MPSETIAIACDHGGVELKDVLLADLFARGLTVLDLGTDSHESVDYPDYAEAVVAAIREGRAGRGILVCGSGIGMSIAANRHPDIRAAVVHDGTTAALARRHNDANVLCLGQRTTGTEVARDCLRAFLDTEFEGGRHLRRVEKMSRPVSTSPEVRS